jgi:hypothetical protein
VIVTSHSKDLALPGERIGYLAANPAMEGVEQFMEGAIFCNRVLGFVNAPALMQRLVAKLQHESVDIEEYRAKRDLLYGHLTDLGFRMVKPKGGFYLFPESPMEDDVAFVQLAQRYNILLVPGRGFGAPGYFRIAYCLDMAQIQRSLPAWVRGVLCNWLVCLAVFMATAARDVTGKMLACYAPIMAFVASGFEHSVANMYFIPAGLFIDRALDMHTAGLTWGNFVVGNLVPVTLGNIVGGAVFVAFAYWYVHLKREPGSALNSAAGRKSFSRSCTVTLPRHSLSWGVTSRSRSPASSGCRSAMAKAMQGSV